MFLHLVSAFRGNKHIKWDEETIAQHDLDRGTRMKIEEPNTPYHHYVEDEDEDLGMRDGSFTEAREQRSPCRTPQHDLTEQVSICR